MDDFREWLSDNLRYILLGLAIILGSLFLYFGLRLVVSVFRGQGQEQPQVEQAGIIENEKVPEEETIVLEPTVTVEPIQEENQLIKEEDTPVAALVTAYYEALGNRDVETLKTMVDTLNPEEETAIRNAFAIEGYYDTQIYTQEGLTEDSWVVFACYKHKYKDYDTMLPGAGYLYLDTDAEGKLYIVSKPDGEQLAHIEKVIAREDVQKLIADTQAQYDAALEQDAGLRAYLSQ